MSAGHLAGRAAVVTGGSRGIGLAIAQSLVAEGVDVMICARSVGELADAVRGTTQRTPDTRNPQPGRIEWYAADIRDPSHMNTVVAQAAETFGRLDILINNAGVGRFGHLAEMSFDDWRAVLETNHNGVFLACQAVVPVLQRGGGGWIINIGSLAGSHPFAGGSAYCASKAGLNALSEVLMQEVRHDNIRVSCVAPGSVSTEFGGSSEAERDDWKLTANDVARTVVDLLRHDPRSLPSRVEIRPSRPRK